LYGNEPENVVNTITNGASNGMIAYKEQLSEDQIKQVASYILFKLNNNEDSK
jgi:mono/diheme cytochrome c family protein